MKADASNKFTHTLENQWKSNTPTVKNKNKQTVKQRNWVKAGTGAFSRFFRHMYWRELRKNQHRYYNKFPTTDIDLNLKQKPDISFIMKFKVYFKQKVWSSFLPLSINFL